MKINLKKNTARRDLERTESRDSRNSAARKGWTDFYTRSAVPSIFSMQECFKQEQR